MNRTANVVAVAVAIAAGLLCADAARHHTPTQPAPAHTIGPDLRGVTR